MGSLFEVMWLVGRWLIRIQFDLALCLGQLVFSVWWSLFRTTHNRGFSNPEDNLVGSWPLDGARDDK